jgi:CTP:molybdopterin cytidylyltransferase MocA
MIWVGPETVTSLIEAHGAYPAAVLQPAWRGEAGWPVLVPVAHLDVLRGVARDRMPLDVVEDLVGVVRSRTLEVGDPGVIHDVDTAPADLPAYEGPPEPIAAHAHEWGADVAAEAGLPEP